MHRDDYTSKLETAAQFWEFYREAEKRRLVEIARGTGLYNKKTSLSSVARRFKLYLLRWIDISHQTIKIYRQDCLDVTVSSWDKRKRDV
jgi:hypothetical protein